LWGSQSDITPLFLISVENMHTFIFNLTQGTRVNEKDLNGKTALGFADDRREIEAVLESHPGVRNALVLVREDHPGEKRLVVYYVGTEAPEAVRVYLQAKLPGGHMVPAVFMQLAALPLKPNGKVDRQALPVPERDRKALCPPLKRRVLLNRHFDSQAEVTQPWKTAKVKA
jgi:hypothetical protein